MLILTLLLFLAVKKRKKSNLKVSKTRKYLLESAFDNK